MEILRTNHGIWLVMALAIANVLLCMPRNNKLPVLGGLLLFCVIPGLALLNLLFVRSVRFRLLPKLLLRIALSYVLSNLIVLPLSLLPGGISIGLIVLALNLVSLTLIGAWYWLRAVHAEVEVSVLLAKDSYSLLVSRRQSLGLWRPHHFRAPTCTLASG